MTATKYKYGTEVIEFFKHDDAELQTLIEQAEQRYYSLTQSLHYLAPAANEAFKRQLPLLAALTELQSMLDRGYTIKTDGYADYHNLDFEVTLTKPIEVQEPELAALREQVAIQYEEDRWNRNVAETERQIQITVERNEREAAAKAEQAAAKKLAAAKASALADLQAAYN